MDDTAEKVPEENESSDMDVSLNDIMSALVAANRFGFQYLTQYCERVLSLHLGHYFPHNALNCLEFAQSYGIARLERQCIEILKKSPKVGAVPSNAGSLDSNAISSNTGVGAETGNAV
jgi:hypothetical protein